MRTDKSSKRTVDLLLSGKQPREIAEIQEMDLKLVYDNLTSAVSEGSIDRVDIWFRLDLNDLHYRFLHEEAWLTRNIEHISIFYVAHPSFDLDEVTARREAEFFLWVRNCAGDYYSLLHQIETNLHYNIGYCLKLFFGENWWKAGLNKAIRDRCNMAYEDDKERLEPIAQVISREDEEDYSLPLGEFRSEFIEPEADADRFMYITFTDHRKILADNWRMFMKVVPQKYEAYKRVLMDDLERVRWLRNIFAHPTKTESYLWKNRRASSGSMIMIERNDSAYEDYKFLKAFRDEIDPLNWRTAHLLGF